MSNPPEKPWSTNPDAPKISERVHLFERSYLASSTLAAILLGVILVTFFRCMGALLSPDKRSQRSIKWLLVAHTVAMFSLAMVSTVTSLHIMIVAAIDNRKFPGATGRLPPGIIGYYEITDSMPITIVSDIPFFLNGLLADGLLLYRCHMIYAMDYRVIAFPCLLYISSVGTGIMYTFENSQYGTHWGNGAYQFHSIYLSISLSLNIVLTLMIVARLILRNRTVQNAVESLPPPDGLIGFVSTILTESCALYSIASVLYITLWIIDSYIVNYIIPIFEASQVIGPFLIILRVANRTAVTSDVGSGSISSIRFGSGEGSTQGDRPSVDETSGSLVDGHSETPGEIGVGNGNDIQEVPLDNGALKGS